MIRAAALICATGVLACAAPLVAQDVEDDSIMDMRQQVGSRFSLEPETVEQQQVRTLQKRVANCVWNKNEELVREMLVNSDFYQIHFDDIDLGQETFGDDLGIDHCIGRAMRGRYSQLGMRYQYASMRNLLAEEAYLADFGTPPAVETGVERQTPDRFEGRYPHPQVTGMAQLADCIIYGAPQMAHDLLSSRPGSDAESAAMLGLGTSFAGCSGDNAAEISVSTSLMRQMVADGMWARSHFGQGMPAPAVSSQANAETAAANSGTLERALAQCIHDADPALGQSLLAADGSQDIGQILPQVVQLCPVTGAINLTDVLTYLRELKEGDVSP